jgi:DNA-binding HxlR family transcriptional regulator
MKNPIRTNSSVSSFLDIVGDKWSLIIIRDLFLQRTTFSQLLESSGEKISTNILTERLKKLISHDIIDFIKDRNDHKVKHYYLTDKGVDLGNVLYEISIWSTKHLELDEKISFTEFKAKTEKIPRETLIREGSQKYSEHRKKLLEFHNALDFNPIKF